MKKKMIAVIAVITALMLLAGCGGGNTAQQAQTTAGQEAAVAEAATEAAQEAVTEAAQLEEVTQAAQEAVTEAAQEAVTEAAQLEEVTQAAQEAVSESKPMASLPRLSGGLVSLEEPEAPQELTPEEQENMDRAMRAYTPSGDTLLVNNAEEFYYYSKMTDDEKELYNAMLMVAQDPVDENNIVKAHVSMKEDSPEFSNAFLVAYLGLLYDHPELFWLYNASECDICTYAPLSPPAEGTDIYLGLDKPYANYEKEMKAFNDAAEAFLKDIDLKADPVEIEKQIHDKLINMVTYDVEVSDKTSMREDLAHTAYGALVENSRGSKNYAVCDGYSQAFVYLLQQAGINAAVIVGAAGDSTLSVGGHAWSVVELDGDWYEVDSTWDDAGTLDEQVAELKDTDELSYTYYKEALDDADYRDQVEHSLYNITTDKMTTFSAGDDYNYTSKDGLITYSLVMDTVHIRADKATGFESYAPLINLAPQAKGTKYQY